MLRLLLILLSVVICSDNSTLLLSIPENVNLRQNSFAYPVAMANFPKCGSYSKCEDNSNSYVLHKIHLIGMIDQVPTEVEWEYIILGTTCDDPSYSIKFRSTGKFVKRGVYNFICEDVYCTIDSSIFSVFNCPEISADVEFPLMTTTCEDLRFYRKSMQSLCNEKNPYIIEYYDSDNYIGFLTLKLRLYDTDTCKKVEEESGVNWVVIVIAIAIVIIVIVIVVVIAVKMNKKRPILVKKALASQTV